MQQDSLPLPCRKIFIKQIEASFLSTDYANQTRKSEEFVSKSRDGAFRFTNIWIQGLIADRRRDHGNEVLTIDDETGKADIYGIEQIFEKHSFLVDDLKKGLY